jgi:hypothetical protein
MGQIAVGSPMSVDNDQFEILISGQKPGHVPANPTKPVQSNPDSHYVSPLFLSQIVSRFVPDRRPRSRALRFANRSISLQTCA